MGAVLLVGAWLFGVVAVVSYGLAVAGSNWRDFVRGL